MLRWSDSWSLIMIKQLTLGRAPEIRSGLKQHSFRIPRWPLQSFLGTQSLKHSRGVFGFAILKREDSCKLSFSRLQLLV